MQKKTHLQLISFLILKKKVSEIWELEQSEILSLLQNLPRASHIVLGINSGKLSAMLNRLAVQVAEADGLVHDLELAAAHELELVLEDLYALQDLEEDFEQGNYIDPDSDIPFGKQTSRDS